MADEKTDPNDPTDAEKRLLIVLKAKQISLRSAENFLKNRSWDIFSTSEIKTALPAILSGKAAYILLTVEHANQKVMKLPQIINHTLKTPIIYFAEGLSPQGPALLNELKYPYVIYPPVSGPAIERMILRIEREQREAQENGEPNAMPEAQIRDNGTDNKDSLYRASSSGRGDNDVTIQAGRAREEIDKIFGSDKSNEMEFFSHQKGNSGAFSTQPPTAADQVIANAMARKGSGVSSAHSAKQEGHGSANTHSLKQEGISSAHSVRPTEVNLADDVRNYLSGENHATPNVRGESDVFGNKGKSLGKSIIVGLDKGKTKKEEPASQKVSGVPTTHGENVTVVLPGRGTATSDSILIQGTQHAVEKLVKPPVGVVHSLGKSTRLHCFFVESEKFRGYVLVAYAQNQDLEKRFKQDLHKTFVQFIKAAGLKIEIKDSSDITIIEVDFEDWSLSESEFLVKSVHAGAEVAVTFFPADKNHSVVEPSKDGKMLQVALHDIEEDVPLDFDLYLHMPTNNKYFHYTKKNGRITKEQKERLLNSKKAHLHVLPEAKEKVAAYRTTKFVNEKIQSHKKKKAS